MVIERDADDVARCFALERALYEGDAERPFAGEVVGLISAGAFVAFGGDLARSAGVAWRRIPAGRGSGARRSTTRGCCPCDAWCSRRRRGGGRREGCQG